MKFGELKTGDVMTLAGKTAVILAIEKPHPLNPHFWMFVWWMFEDKRFSFDMLAPEYELIHGAVIRQDRMYSFRKAMDEIPR